MWLQLFWETLDLGASRCLKHDRTGYVEENSNSRERCLSVVWTHLQNGSRRHPIVETKSIGVKDECSHGQFLNGPTCRAWQPDF